MSNDCLCRRAAGVVIKAEPERVQAGNGACQLEQLFIRRYLDQFQINTTEN